MRLIDADELIKQIEADAEHIETPLAKMFLYANISDIKHAPTIAQPERKIGEWREHIFDGIMGRRPRALMCTNCNVISIYASNFCPNCGAEMREASND